MHRPAALILILAAGLGLAGCSSLSSWSPFSTGSTSASALAAPQVVNSPENRLTQVAWTAERANRCHFYLDQDKLKANYLAYEVAQGTSAQSQQNMVGAYDKLRKLFAERIQDPTYCSAAVNSEVEADLARYLSGDFSARAVKTAQDDSSWFTPKKPGELGTTEAARKAATE